MSDLKSYAVWDAGTRWFHWINFLSVIGLIAVGTVILYAGDLGIPNEGKIALKVVHTWIGYVFALNLFWRFVWAFIGNRYARWGSFLPGGRGYFGALREYVSGFRTGHPPQYLGHNPAARLGLGLMFLLLAIMAVTGAVLAGTDIFYPPIGPWIAEWIAPAGIDPASLQPYAKETYDAAAYESMRAFRKPFITLHLYSFYGLLAVIVLHIVAVVTTDIREEGNIISAMFTGRKVTSGRPVDAERNPDDS